jgi:hypothetical protein
MRNSLILIVLTIILTSFTSGKNQQNIHTTTVNQALQNNDALCSINNNSFVTGEELTYKVYYNWNFVWIAAGEVTFKVLDQGDKYYVSAKGRTYNSYDWAFKVRDEYKVWIDKETMLPRTSIRNVKEGGYQLYDMMKYDHEKMQIRSYRGKTKDDTRKFTFDIQDCTHDVLSIIYYVRNKNYNEMKKGEKFPIRIFLDKEKYSLETKFVGRETKKIKDLGTFKTLKLMPEVVKGEVFNDTSGMTIWASDDKNKIPLQIESPLSVGTAKAVLKSYKKVRYPMSSKIK